MWWMHFQYSVMNCIFFCRHLPCGIYPPGEGYPPEPNLSNDNLYSVKQRHSYFNMDADSKKGAQFSAHQRHASNKGKATGRPSVRLRPRQVLCSNCHSICNEKNESVGSSRNQKYEAAGNKISKGESASAMRGQTSVSGGKKIHPSSGRGRETRRSSTLGKETRQTSVTLSEELHAPTRGKRKCTEPNTSTLVPKLKKLKLSEIETASSNAGALKETNIECSPTCKLNNASIKCCKENNKTGKGKQSVNLHLSNISSAQSPSTQEDLNCDKSVNNLQHKSSQIHIEKSEDRIPKLRLSANVSKNNFVSKKVPKVTINTTKLQTAKNGLSTRSRSIVSTSTDHNVAEPAIPKMILSTSLLNDSEDRGRESPMIDTKKKGKTNDIECKLKINQHNASNLKSVDNSSNGVDILPRKEIISPVPKLTILPFGQKKNETCDTLDIKNLDDANKPHSTLLKICIAPDGTGTIMNISPKSGHSKDEDVDEETQRRATASIAAKAAKRALKKAKKEAQRKSMMGGISPSYSLLGGMSPRFGGMSPMRLGGMSPARPGFGCDRLCGVSPARASPGRFSGASPGRFYSTSSNFVGIGAMSPARTPLDHANKDLTATINFAPLPKKHRHKVKHKKKHKDERRHKQGNENNIHSKENRIEVGSSVNSNVNISTEPETLNDDAPVNNSLVISTQSEPISTVSSVPVTESSSRTSSPVVPGRHKLSLSIKRVHNDSNEYVACDSNSCESNSYITESSDKDGFVSECSDCSNSSKPAKKSKRTIESDGPENFSKLKLVSYASPGEIDCVSSDDQCDVPNFPAVSDRALGELSLKFRWRDIHRCCIRPLYSQLLRQQDSGTHTPTEDELPNPDTLMEVVLKGTEEGHHWITVGDIVWGKIHGFPWWPAKVCYI